VGRVPLRVFLYILLCICTSTSAPSYSSLLKSSHVAPEEVQFVMRSGILGARMPMGEDVTSGSAHQLCAQPSLGRPI
jgi:hypothetical protein